MQVMKKHVGVGATKVYATNVIYSCIIGLQASESTLKMQVETSNRHTDQDNSLNIDGSAVLWFIPWPTNGNVHDYCVYKEGGDFDHQES